MAAPYLARGETSIWFHVARVVVTLAMVVGVVVYLTGEQVGGACIAVPSFILMGILEVRAFIIKRGRLWLEVTDDGFKVRDWRSAREYRDTNVTAIAYTTKNRLSNGKPNGFSRTCKVWLSGETEPLIFENAFNLTQSDPLAAFIKRLLDLLSAGFGQALEQGIPLQGDGWSLTNLELSYTQRGTQQTIRIDDISVVEDHDGKMGIWRRDDELPCAQFPCDGRNVWLLRNVLLPRLKKVETSGPPATGLGRVLFQRTSTLFYVISLAVIGLGLAAGGVFLTVTTGQWIYAAGGIFLGMAFGQLGSAYRKTKFRCHEWGVFKTGMFSEHQLKYANVKSFSYGATRHYHNGAYVGTNLVMSFIPNSKEHGKPISYRATVHGSDDELERLRDFISGLIAKNMTRELATTGRAQWTSNIAFLEKGFEYRPSGLLGRKDPVFMPYENYGGYNVSSGFLNLFEKGKTRAVVQEAASVPNFFPGLVMLLGRFHRK